MNESILQKYSGRRLEDTGLLREEEGVDDAGAYGWLRGIRDRAAMLELRKKDGSILAVSYSWLERVEFNPSEGITLHLGGRSVRIKGRNLNINSSGQQGLFQGITRHRVPWIQEKEQAAFAGQGSAVPIIERIEW